MHKKRESCSQTLYTYKNYRELSDEIKKRSRPWVISILVSIFIEATLFSFLDQYSKRFLIFLPTLVLIIILISVTYKLEIKKVEIEEKLSKRVRN